MLFIQISSCFSQILSPFAVSCFCTLYTFSVPFLYLFCTFSVSLLHFLYVFYTFFARFLYVFCTNFFSYLFRNNAFLTYLFASLLIISSTFSLSLRSFLPTSTHLFFCISYTPVLHLFVSFPYIFRNSLTPLLHLFGTFIEKNYVMSLDDEII